MSVVRRLTAEADSAAMRYGIMVETWRGIYHRAVQDSRFGTAKLSRVISEEAYAVARDFIASERSYAVRTFSEIANEGQRETLAELGAAPATELDSEAAQLVAETVDYLLRELTIQVERDIAFLIESVRRTYLSVRMAAQAQGVSVKRATLEYLVGNATELHFFFHDRRNQKWPSRKFVRAVWRLGLLSAYNETVLLTLADHRVDVAEIRYADPTAKFHGMKLALAPNGAMPTYAEIRAEIFHPNADAIVGSVSV